MQNSLKPEEILGLTRQFGLYEWSAQNQVNPLAVSRAKGVYFWTSDGKRYLDFNSQLMCVNIGHGDERVLDAIRAQLDQLAYVTPFITTEPRAILHKTLAELAPGNLNRSFFTLGGADANENAIKIARLFTGRHKIIARYRSYHGATGGAVTLTGDPRRWPAEPGIPGVIHVQDPYEYRCRWCKDAGACNMNCLNHIEDVIQFEGPKTIAAIIMEPVTGTNGLIIPPDGYMAGVRSLCDKYGILFIADEVMSGFGRTGEWFAVNHWQVVPDLMTVAKGLTSAYVPLGAVIMKEEIASHFDSNVLSAGLTFNSHPVCCAAAIATIDVYKQDKLIENARNMGRILGAEMEKLREKHPSVGDVRYIGLFALFELVKNRKTREPMAPFNARADEMGAMGKLNKFFRDNGLYTFVRWNTFFANPPLCITESQLMEGLAIIDKGLEITDEAVVD